MFHRYKVQYFALVAAVAIGLFCSTLYIQKPVVAQSITGINSEISSLRSRINRLESQFRNLRNSNSNSFSNSPSNSSEPLERVPRGVVGDRVIGSSDPLTERLATLIIELKEDIRNIETRLDTLEERQNS